LLLPHDLRLTPRSSPTLCAAIPKAVPELTADGQRIAMTPASGYTSPLRNSLLFARVQMGALGRSLWPAFADALMPLAPAFFDAMRTTLTINDGLLRQLRQKALDSGKPFKQVVNEALRAGLEQPATAARPPVM
jgi:hypothetical protein